MTNIKTKEVLAINCSFKHGLKLSRTEELAELVLQKMKDLVRGVDTGAFMSDKRSFVSLGIEQELDDKDWPKIARYIQKIDILIFVTPIWYGGRSSLAQGVIEIMDSLEKETVSISRSDILGTGVELGNDNAQATLSGIMEFLTFFNFTLPSQCCKHWKCEKETHHKIIQKNHVKNKAVEKLAENIACNLIQFTRSLKQTSLLHN